MKKLAIILLCLLISSSVFAFEKGTKAFGGGVDFNSSKVNSDADASSTFMADLFGGYFVMDNVMATAIIEYYNNSQGDVSTTEYLFGFGGDYFFDKFFAGAALMMSGYSHDNSTDVSYSGMYLNFGGGYLMDIVQNVSLSLEANYTMGLGKYGGDMDFMDNEETNLNVGAGIAIFVP